MELYKSSEGEYQHSKLILSETIFFFLKEVVTRAEPPLLQGVQEIPGKNPKTTFQKGSMGESEDKEI